MCQDAPEPIADISFPESLIGKSKYNGEKRRLIIHAGTPKTGTTTLQSYLGLNREKLAERGYWFPPPFKKEKAVKHQHFIHALMHPNSDEFLQRFEGVLEEPPEHCHTIFVTSEGFYNHWSDFSDNTKHIFAGVATLFNTEIWTWFKHPIKFAKSFYAQSLKNPQVKTNRSGEDGRDIDFKTFLEADWFANILDFRKYIEETSSLFGSDTIKAFVAEGDIIDQFEDALGEVFGFERLPNLNISPSQTGIDLLRVVNRLSLDWQEKLAICDEVLALDHKLKHKAPPLKLSLEDEERVLAKAGSQWTYIQAFAKRGDK